jgi:von Hippel-Lindau disease tumor supressor
MSRKVCGLLPLICLSLLVVWPAAAQAEKKHPAEEKGIKSVSHDVEATLKFVNKSGKTVKVYWLDYEGDRKLYQTLQDGESYDQPTYLTHPWVITDENDDAWYVYFPDAQPRSVEIVAPGKN